MLSFTLRLPPTIIEGGDCLAAMLEHCGSLAVPSYLWADLLQRLAHHGDRRADIAEAIVKCATPVEGDIHPERAYYRAMSGEAGVQFRTPGWVEVYLAPVRGEEQEQEQTPIEVQVHFNRDSIYLATMMLAAATRWCYPHTLPLLGALAEEFAAEELAAEAPTT